MRRRPTRPLRGSPSRRDRPGRRRRPREHRPAHRGRRRRPHAGRPHRRRRLRRPPAEGRHTVRVRGGAQLPRARRPVGGPRRRRVPSSPALIRPMLLNVRTHPRLLTCSALTALAVCVAMLAPAGAPPARPPLAPTTPATAPAPTPPTLTGTVDPGARDTAYFFVYGTTSYSQRTPTQRVPAGPPAGVSAPLTGLTPATVYHYRLFAFHPGRPGEADLGADQAFTTAPVPAAAAVPPAAVPAPLPVAPTPAPAPAAPAATLGTTVVAAPVRGAVRVKAPGATGFATLAAGAAIPVGWVLDARRGTVALTTALDGGGTQTATFHSGVFQVRQSKTAHGLTDIFLRGPALRCGPTRGSARAAAVAKRKPPKRQLWGRDNGGGLRPPRKKSTAPGRRPPRAGTAPAA